MNIALPDNPIEREIRHFRDDRKIVIACDDTYAPKQYFSEIELPRTEIVVIPAEDNRSYITYVIDRLLQEEREEDDEMWLVLDTDHCVKPNNVGTFSSEIGRASRMKIKVALSRPCFEYWLALYHAEPEALKKIHSARDLEVELGRLVAKFRENGCGYSKVNVQTSDFPLELLSVAIQRAAKRDASVDGGRIPEDNTTRMYLLWTSVLERFEEFQLPQEYLAAYHIIKEQVAPPLISAAAGNCGKEQS